ncbi:hypothetical protein MMC22_009804 [Lobaria immixta]|nr:hypothetical protein [Lobaria immixta]
MYALRVVPGKGKGLVATEKISKGTRILSEEPIITVPPYGPDSEQLRTSIYQQVDALSEHQRRAFLSMHNLHAYRNAAEQYIGIIRTNALPIETNESEGGIFLEACCINHACDNNAQKHWNGNIKRHTVHALRDIDKGEEVTIYYLGVHKNREARNKALQTKFGFVRLYNEQGPDDAGLPRAFLDAAQIAIANGDLARGRIFAERAVSGWWTTLGGDSKEVMEHGTLARDPSKHRLSGISMKWKTTVDEAPRGLEPSDFEDWLWKREKPKRSGQLADLRSHGTFPGFIDLPDENNVDLDFYESSDMATYRPRRHWCFLGEIVDFAMLVRLQMEIKDVDGRKIPLYFYTDGRSNELAPALVQGGYTVAILYAQRHAFMFDKPGIRHEDPRMLKVPQQLPIFVIKLDLCLLTERNATQIFPLSLHELLALNDQVQQFSTEVDRIRMCHGCGRKAASLKRCGKCLSFWYCDRACQEAGWNEKGHKTHCKLLKDSDLRGLFLLKWDEFDNHVRFPLHAAED